MKTPVSSYEAYKLLHDGAIVLSEIEAAGVCVNVNYLKSAIKSTHDKINDLQKQMREDKTYRLLRRRFGEKFNMGSRDQLGTIVFDTLGFESKHMTSTGKNKTDEEAFQHVDLPYVKMFIQAEKLKKATGTYLEGILSEVTPDGFVHPSYNLNTVTTFRSSCNNPNFQNIPNRNPEIAKMVRQCYTARPGNHLIEIDFAQLEVRIAACYNKDPVLINYINDKSTDMHRDMACELFMLDEKQVTKKGTRDSAKNQFVFPEFYGSVYFQCAPNIWNAMERRKFMIEGTETTVLEHLRKKGIKKLGNTDPKFLKENGHQKGTFVAHVKKVEEALWNKFAVYARWRKEWFYQYQRKGYFQMYTGFVVKEPLKRNDVINYPVQGAAFHCLLWSLIAINKILRKRKMKSLLVGQIHDCLIGDVPPNEKQDFLHICHEVMTKKLLEHWRWINVPLEIEAEVAPIGGTWYDKKVEAITL